MLVDSQTDPLHGNWPSGVHSVNPLSCDLDFRELSVSLPAGSAVTVKLCALLSCVSLPAGSAAVVKSCVTSCAVLSS